MSKRLPGLKAKVGDYQARLNDEPVSEQQLADLTRGYDQSKANYDDLLKKENESKMATSMEADATRGTIPHDRSTQFAAETRFSQPAQILWNRAGPWSGVGACGGGWI